MPTQAEAGPIAAEQARAEGADLPEAPNVAMGSQGGGVHGSRCSHVPVRVHQEGRVLQNQEGVDVGVRLGALPLKRVAEGGAGGLPRALPPLEVGALDDGRNQARRQLALRSAARVLLSAQPHMHRHARPRQRTARWLADTAAARHSGGPAGLSGNRGMRHHAGCQQGHSPMCRCPGIAVRVAPHSTTPHQRRPGGEEQTALVRGHGSTCTSV